MNADVEQLTRLATAPLNDGPDAQKEEETVWNDTHEIADGWSVMSHGGFGAASGPTGSRMLLSFSSDASRPVGPKPLPLLDAADILGGPLPPVDWVVQGLIARGTRTVVYGAPGGRKSYLLLDLALHLAAGKPWLAHFPVPQRQRVLYIDEEMSENTLRQRIKRLADGSGITLDHGWFQALSRAGVRFDGAAARTLLASLEAAGFKPDFIIVETLRRALIGNENAAEDVAQFWRHVGPLLTAGKTFLISHHMPKPSMNGGKRASLYSASGSGDVVGGADCAVAVHKIDRTTVVLECTKLRDAEEPPPVTIVADYEDDRAPYRHYVSHVGADPAQPAGTKKREQGLALICGLLADGQEHDKAEIIKSLESQRIPPSTTEKILTARRGHEFDRVGHGKYRATGALSGNHQTTRRL